MPVAPAAPATTTTPAPANGAPKGATEAPATDPKPNAAPAKPVEPKPEQPWKAKRKLVVGGKEVEREYDDRRLQILEHNELQRATHLKERQEFEARLAKLTDNPDELFAEAGFDVEAYIEQRRTRLEQMKTLSPAEQRAMVAEQKLAKMEKDLAAQKQREAQATEQREHQSYVQQNVQRLSKAIEISGQPRSGELLRLLTEVQEMAAHNGEPELTPEQLAQHGERLQVQRVTALLKAAGNEAWRARNGALLADVAKAVLPALEGDALLDWLGPENVKRAVAASYAKLKRSPTPIVQETPRETPAPAAPNSKPVIGWDEAAERFGF